MAKPIDFNAFLKYQKGYQKGDIIPRKEVSKLRQAYSQYTEEEAKSSALKSADAVKIEALLGRHKESGDKINSQVVASISSLFDTGQSDKAVELVESIVQSEPAGNSEPAKSGKQGEDLKEQEQALFVASEAGRAISMIDTLKKSEGFSGVFGVGAGAKWLPATEAKTAEGMRKTIVGLASLDAIKKFQGLGAMSNKEFGTAQQSVTLLQDSLISEKDALVELDRLKGYFSKSIERAEALGRIPKGTKDSLLKDEVVTPTTVEGGGIPTLNANDKFKVMREAKQNAGK